MSDKPLSKNELYLDACCEGCGCTGLPEPLTRKEQLLYELAEKLVGGGGGTGAPFVDSTKLTFLDYFCKNGNNLGVALDKNFRPINVVSMMDFFHSCSTITEVQKMETPKCRNLQSFFYNCTSLVTVHGIDTSAASNIKWMFTNCTSLVTIAESLDFGLVQDDENMFENCGELVNVSFTPNNICIWLDLHWSPKLSMASLVPVFQGLRLTLSGRKLILNTAAQTIINGDAELTTLYQSALDAGWIVEFQSVT